MTTTSPTAPPAPYVYPIPGHNGEPANEESLDGLNKNRDAYQWELNDDYPPHVRNVPAWDNKQSYEIFNVQALLQTGGMIEAREPQGQISAYYKRLAPDPSQNISLEQLVQRNRKQRAPPGVQNNMLFRFNIGDRTTNDWYSDAVFAQQSFTGTNATTITQAGDWIAKFKQCAEDAGNKPMADLLQSTSPDDLYVQDYSYFRAAMGASDNEELQSSEGASDDPNSTDRRYAAAPVALYNLEAKGQLHPLAIVIDYKGSMAASVVIFNTRLTSTSGDLSQEAKDWPWRYAKTVVQSADWLRHEVTIHLVNTHLVEETTIVAAHRQLPPSHIVYLLLQKHWETTLPLNDQARTVLVPDVISKLAGVDQAKLTSFLKHAYTSFDWVKLQIPNDLAARGFPEAEIGTPKFHNYAYARNMALMWPAIRKFVAGVLGPYYPSGDADVAKDQYIAAFCNEMASIQGAHMTTFPQIKTFDQLVDTVTMCIHIASPQHTAVNYLQHYYQVFVPNKPWAMYAPLPQSLDELNAYNEQQLLDALPFKKTTDWLIGSQLAYLLSFEVIGQSTLMAYADDQTRSPIVHIAEAAHGFRADLEQLKAVFLQHSLALDDQHSRYMVMDPDLTAVSILI
ncbi:lipoxygenase [Ceratobasidium sp. AG-Ba]|nr:lipoxygenase [Ceratobasidium sp. AG-Ba]